METSIFYSIALAAIASAGLYMLTRYSNFLHVLVGLELVSASAAASLAMWGGSLGFYLFILVLDTGIMALAAALALRASRLHGARSVDELDELRG